MNSFGGEPTIHPLARGLATLTAATGCALVRDPVALGFFWVLLTPLLLRGGLARAQLRFLMWVLMPIAAALIVVWGFVVAAPPGAVPGSARLDGLRFAATTSLRLAALGSLWQLCFLTLPASALRSTLRSWGLSSNGLIVVLGSLVVMPDIVLRGHQVLTARYARGFVATGGWWSRARQLPALLPPLSAWVLRSAIQRGENWNHRGLIGRFESLEFAVAARWSAASICLLLAAFAWLVFGVVSRLS